jgi:hypothetical protein
MKSTGCVFEGKRYISPLGSAAPPTGLPDVTRFANNGAFANETRTQLPSGLWVENFNSNGYANCGSGRSPNFTSNSFSISAWISSAGLGAACYVICQGKTDVDGWGFFVFVNNLSFRLNQSGSHTDISAVNGFAFGRWQHTCVTRTGNTGQFYNNGAPITTIGGGALVDAVSVNGGNNLLIGIEDGLVTNGWIGSVALSKVFNFAISPEQINRIYESERGLFGV